ncbi:diguanylate cyclase (GGDEF)-like protein [Luteimonas terrae]|uniref:histidine kinase n=2 Tax=Luteimonas terrae TaxID=1530191 RepID=A0ABU1Y2S3_9GAMM|nr:diguanylate cyclase (GGDEF)-like protein [Luteimonas terrae]
MRAQLIELQSLVGLLHAVSNGPGSDLAEANGHLVVAALAAQVMAEDAARQRDRVALESLRDPLTETPNRTAMLDRLGVAITAAQRRGTRFAVLFIDIDDFKRINDTFGRPVGDSVLQFMARRLESGLRDTDTVGRYGGEEFLVLLDDLPSSEDASAIVEHLLQVIAAPATIGGHDIALSASLGIALYPDDATDAGSLIARADAAMYCAKRRGRGGYEFCHNVMRHADGSVPLFGVGDAAHDEALRSAYVRSDQHAVLQEANGQLVVSALDARAGEAHAREAQSRQSDAMAMAAHELRNPLTPIRLAADMLDAARDDVPRFARLRGIIDDQVGHIARLVDDLLDGTRITTGKLRLEQGPVDLGQVLEMAVLSCRTGIDARGQQLEFAVLPAGVVRLHADRTRLLQVFTNLLDNACKYTPEGGRIGVCLERFDDHVTVTVRDDGIGIAAEALPQVFDLFVQVGDGSPAHRSGLGIGLALVRELVMAHGGTVVASSDGTGQGSTFVITLPLPVASTPDTLSVA